MTHHSRFATSLSVAGATVAFLACSHPAMAAKITTFDPSGSIKTWANSVSKAGIAGSYDDSSKVQHGC
jgi:hypothetical protein